MSTSQKEKFKKKQLELIIQSPEYIELLKEVSQDIHNESKKAENEASIVSIFELEVLC